MIGLLQAIADTGSISQAAKRCGLSYKGAWQIIERANNTSPQVLISTATGGSKGGGAHLTESGRALLNLFTNLQSQHQNFLARLNQTLIDNPETRLLFQRLAVKTSVRNQLFGNIKAIEQGAVNAKVTVNLSGNLTVEVTLSHSAMKNIDLRTGMDAVLLINSADIMVSVDADNNRYSAANRLSGTVIRITEDDIHADITVLLSNSETLSCLITRHSAKAMGLNTGTRIWIIFKANVPILGLKESG